LRALRHPALRQVRGRGLLVGVEIDPAFAHARTVCEALMHEGVLSKDTHDTVVRFAPPLTVSAAQIDEAVQALGRALAAVEAGQRRPGRQAA
jgi:ornithine--oxo-acid transaminase